MRLKKYSFEALGTLLLVVIGCGSIILNNIFGNIYGDLGIGIAFGLAVSLVIYLFGNISGAHINPAVSFGFYINNQMNRLDLLMYITFQLIGAVLGAAFLFFCFGNGFTLGETLPKVGVIKTFFLEIFITFFLMFVILMVTRSSRIPNTIVPLIIGTTVGILAWQIGPYTGASMNPARSIGPAITSGKWDHLWIYILAPFMGSMLAVLCFSILPKKKKIS